ncbi:hypothetical protein RIF29_40302 [Crotalaria pallida]|uniref:Cystatin domain-containing protein n=1 Tax=Crotalaria pallida TaxID=3830 RepID=A0AAN9E4I5_CROPI
MDDLLKWSKSKPESDDPESLRRWFESIPETPWSSKSSVRFATPLPNSHRVNRPPLSIPSFIQQQQQEEEPKRVCSEQDLADYIERSRELSPYDAISPPPYSNLCGGVAPYLITDSLRPRLIRLCNLALDKFHSDNPGANYVFENIVKITATATSGTTYYITFEARAVAASTCQTFQAHVWDRHPKLGGPVVEECKLKHPLT